MEAQMKAEQLADPALLDFFRALAEELPAMAPLYKLVKRLSAKDYAPLLPAGTSLDRLGIGAADEDAIVVQFLPNVPVFQVSYQPRKTGKPEKNLGDIGMAERLIDSLALRLLLQERYQEDKA